MIMGNSCSSCKELLALEGALVDQALDFTSAYMAVRDVHDLVGTHPQVIRSETISALKKTIENPVHASQKQALFFYREAADTLVSIGTSSSTERDVARLAITTLKSLVRTTVGSQNRAVAESIGSLPLLVRGPSIDVGPQDEIPCIAWEELARRGGVPASSTPTVAGRSLFAPIDGMGRLLVVKLASVDGSLEMMQREILWMEHLRSRSYCAPLCFDVPQPLRVDSKCLFRLKELPGGMNGNLKVRQELYAIGFIAPNDYFLYLNGPREETGLCLSRFKDALFRNAWLMAALAAEGIIHSAPIPLFHNRVQRNRRADLGLYEWPRGGRLDRWLHSCRYPNFGLSGLRDFEHFVSSNGDGSKLYQHIGSHILSLLLVAASYFRYQDPQRVGLDPKGRAIDARDLFDREVLTEMVVGVVRHYYHGFVGTQMSDEMPFDCRELVTRMVEEMGVDRHMEEILRVADQERMTEEEFEEFLGSRGYSWEDIRHMKKGVEDVIIHTGPHLGAFNGRISLPELTELLATVSALCIAGKYLREAHS